MPSRITKRRTSEFSNADAFKRNDRMFFAVGGKVARLIAPQRQSDHRTGVVDEVNVALVQRIVRLLRRHGRYVVHRLHHTNHI